MMGTQAAPEQLFYDFCLEDHVPDDHLLRRIDRFLDLNDVRQKLKPFYCSIGRPSVDPELMIRMLIVGYCLAIRSERRLCEEVHLNLAYRWFCRLGLDGQVPDHSTFSRNRHGRFRQSNLLRHLFETVVRWCMAEGLVGGEGFAVDASLIEADANKQRSVPGQEWSVEDIPANGHTGDQRLSCPVGRYRLRRCQRGDTEVRLAIRSGSPVDRCAARTSLLRLCQQLSDRHWQRDHRRCRKVKTVCHAIGDSA